MTRTLKAVGIALIAAAAVGAIAATWAWAESSAEIELGTKEGTIHAQLDGEATFTRQGRVVICEEAAFFAHVEDHDTAVTTTEPAFAECKPTVIEGKATVAMNECHFNFNLTADSEDNFTAIAALGCPEGKEATLTIYTLKDTKHEETPICQYAFPAQENLTTIDLSNLAADENTPKDWVRAHVNLSEIKSTRTHGGLITCGSMNDALGSLEATFKLKGKNTSGEDVDMTVATDK